MKLQLLFSYSVTMHTYLFCFLFSIKTLYRASFILFSFYSQIPVISIILVLLSLRFLTDISYSIE